LARAGPPRSRCRATCATARARRAAGARTAAQLLRRLWRPGAIRLSAGRLAESRRAQRDGRAARGPRRAGAAGSLPRSGQAAQEPVPRPVSQLVEAGKKVNAIRTNIAALLALTASCASDTTHLSELEQENAKLRQDLEQSEAARKAEAV